MEGIKDKKVLITGGSSGIGLATVNLLLRYGAHVGIACNSTQKINGLEGKYKIYTGDLTSTKFIYSLVERFHNDFCGLDILINNAGTISSKDFLALETDDFEEMFSLNLYAPYYLMRDSFKYMMAHGGGKIINISSISVKYGGSPNTSHYAVSKMALETLSTQFARQGVKHNILVNCVRPGYTDTPIHDKLGRSEKDKEKRISLIPLKRAGKPEEVAGMICFLASDYGNFSVGEIFTLSGGD